MVIPEIVNYIVAESENGTSSDAIAGTLFQKGGWRAEDIIDSFISIGFPPPSLPRKMRLFARLRKTIGYTGLAAATFATLGALTWYALILLRSSEDIVEHSLLRLFSAQSVSATVLIKPELTGPSVLFNPILGHSATAFREVVNGTIRINGNSASDDLGNIKSEGFLRVDIASSRFPAGEEIKGEMFFAVEDPIVYADLPSGSNEQLFSGIDSDSSVVSFDLAKTLSLKKLGLSIVERAKLLELFAQYQPFELENYGETFNGSSKEYHFGYKVNPYSLKFILRDFSATFPDTFSTEKLTAAETFIDSVVFEDSEFFIDKQTLEPRRFEAEVTFIPGNMYGISGYLAVALLFEGINQPVEITVPENAALLRIEDLFPLKK